MRNVTVGVLVILLFITMKTGEYLLRAQKVKKLRKSKFRNKLLWFLSAVTIL